MPETPVAPPALTVTWIECLAEAAAQIQASATLDIGLKLLVQAAWKLVGASLVSASAEPAPGGGGGYPLLTSKGKCLGVLSVAPVASGFSPAESSLLGELARLGGLALENVELRERLGEQEERLRLALQAASLGTWEHIPESHATHWDARSKAIFGLPPDAELDFERYVAALHPADKERVFAGIAKAMDPAGNGECSLQYRIFAADGAERWVEAHGRCAFVDGVPQRINGTLLDISERRRAEEAIQQEARRKDEFLALLGHELRNPLAPILTALELMRLRQPAESVRERDVIERQVRHMMRLVDDLLDLARIARGSITLRLEDTDLLRAVEHAVEIASPLFEARHHQLAVDVPSGLVVAIDPMRFSQVVSNLLTNAAKFTPPGGHIRVRGHARGAEVILEIEDDGIGIDPEQIETIFEPFVQAHRHESQTYGGLGLGLSLARDLIQLHRGRVEVESAGAGRGSRFTVALPVSVKLADTLPPSPRANPRVARPRRVLVVDDNEDSAELLGQLLAQLGHDVRIAHDGPRALSVASELIPEVAVLDIGLPVMDGYELAARLRELYGANGLRLVALTGFGQDTDKARSLAAGFHRHLTKPIEARELLAALAE
jgi:PAS domain S-box-containing protein